MIEIQTIKQIESAVREYFEGEGTGHDWWHIDRVRKVALAIAKEEKARLDIVEVAALVHDVGDWKISTDTRSQREQIIDFLAPFSLDLHDLEEVVSCAESVSFSKSIDTKQAIEPKTREAKIVQDADRLDALGAIGIARVFAFGGKHKRPLYDPTLGDPKTTTVEEAYTSGKQSSLHHIYGKLLQLQALLHTDAAKNIAKERHAFLETYLMQFFKEWEGR